MLANPLVVDEAMRRSAMKEQLLTPELQAKIHEVHEMRVLAGNPPPVEQTIAEMALNALYGRDLQLDEVQPGYRLGVVPRDLNGQTVKVVLVRRWPARPYSRSLDVDLQVYAMVNGSAVQFYGWLPVSEVENFPVTWFEKDGRRVDYCHEIEVNYLALMPEEFRFVQCTHLADWLGIWEYGQGWRCAGCRGLVWSPDDAERFVQQDSGIGGSNSISADKAGVERQGAV